MTATVTPDQAYPRRCARKRRPNTAPIPMFNINQPHHLLCTLIEAEDQKLFIDAGFRRER